MIKNLHIYCEKNIFINKITVHKIIAYIKKNFNLTINYLDINFVSPKTILELNKKFLNHNYLTDVIAFNYSSENNNLDGEIFICNDVAKENAKFFKVSSNSELRRLIIHGILHLIGYNDKTKIEKNKMKQIEDLLVKRTKNLGVLDKL